MKQRERRRARRLDQLRFSLERLLLRGLHYRLLLAASIVLLVALLAGLLVRLLAPGFDEVGESIWWAFLRLTDPGYLGDDEGLVGRTVSTVVTVLGYVLFLGLLIAILTQWMNELIARIESGTRPVTLADHVLILGLTHRTPNIVLELLRTRGRVTRFLEVHNASTLRVVVLAEQVDGTVLAELREHLGSFWNDRQVLLRGGSPLKLEHLERVSFEDAAAIILPGEDFSNRSPGVADADTLKSLLLIARHTRGSSENPLAVVALYDENRSNVARFAYRGETEILATDQVMSRLIAQSVCYAGIWGVFSQLLSINEGNAIFLRRLRERGKTFGELRRECPKAVPIGLIPSGARHPLLNPAADTELGENDLIVFIARSFADCAERAPGSGTSDSKALSTWEQPSRPQRLLILGWNRKVPALLREFAADDMAIDVVGLTPVEDRMAALASCQDLALDHVRQIEKNFLDPVRLAELEPSGYDQIILLARARMGDEAHADAATITAYLSLQHIFTGHEAQPKLFVEILEEENRFLFDNAHDVLVTPLAISYMLSQIALRRELAAIFTELSRIGGPQITLRTMQAADYPEPIGFDTLATIAEQHREIALGVLTAVGEVHLNPDRGERLAIRDGDQLVTLTTVRDPG
ncbi:MAG: hypothetical protein U9Q81_26245 [Pseudomonadota bacterium]|nr:hypothetical protein [Pseudomonadota bacterium]